MSRERFVRRPCRRRLWWLCIGLILALAISAAPPGLDRARQDGLDSFGAVDTFAYGGLRFDPFFARGLVLDGVRLSLGELSVRMPSLFVRPDLRAALRGRIEPAFVAPRFEARVSAESTPEALLAIYRALEQMRWRGEALTLRGGRVLRGDGEPIAHHLQLELRRESDGVRVVLRARQRHGGRIDVVGRLASDGEGSRLEIYLDSAEVGDLRGWLASRAALPARRIAATPILTRATGRWLVTDVEEGGVLHHIDVRLDGVPQSGVLALSDLGRPSARLALQLTGSAAILPGARRAPAESRDGPPGDADRRLEGWVRVELRAGRLETFAFSEEGSTRLLISGPVHAWATLTGSLREPRVSLSASLDAARLEAGSWLGKPSGVPARLQIAPSAKDPVRSLRLDVAVGEATASGSWDGGRGLRLRTGWLPVATLRPWVPVLQERARGGALRVALESAGAGASLVWRLDLDRVELDPSPIATTPIRLSGTGRVTAGRLLEAEGLRARLGRSRFRVDLRAEQPAGAEELELRFRARAGRVDLTGLDAVPGGVPEEERPSSDLGFPAALQVAVERPLGLLQRVRDRLGGVQLQSGRLEADEVDCGDELLRQLFVDLSLQGRRLEVRRFSFQQRDRLRDYHGHIDLNPLVPRVQISERPVMAPLPAALPPS